MTAVERHVAFLLADLAGYVALTEAHGNAGALEAIERLLALVQGALAPGARLVERVGDQVVVAADDAGAALDTALRLLTSAAAEPRFPPLRIGGHAGLVLDRDGAYFGAALNVAARVAARARPGQVLCTAAFAEAARGRPGVVVQSLGSVPLRHMVEPVELFEVTAGVETKPGAVIDPVCHMQLVPADAVASVRRGDRTYYFCCEGCATAFADRPDAFAGD